MQLRLKNQNDVFRFTAAVTLICLIGNTLLQWLFIPEVLLHYILITSSFITIIIAIPVVYFIGKKMLEVHFLTLELEHAASHDKLTGLHTRASFYDKLEQTGLFPCAVVVADIDYFKKINDAHGHRGGDQALQHFSTTLVCNCREDDIVARFGGEEFVIVLRNSTLENGLDVARRLCERIRSKKLCFDHKVIEITASFGVSTAHDLSDIDSSIHLADLALYRAKRAGRNRVFAYDPSLDDTSAGSIAKHDQPCHAPISLASNG